MFDNNFYNLFKNEAIIKFRYLFKQIAYGYLKGSDRGVKRKKRKVLELTLDMDNIEWLHNLDDKYVIQIGNTFYRKGGSCFIYDYHNPSVDYLSNLMETVENQVNIFIDGDLPDQGC